MSPDKKYLVRIASSDGPGSYPITIEPKDWTQLEIIIFNYKFTFTNCIAMILTIVVFYVTVGTYLQSKIIMWILKNTIDKQIQIETENVILRGYTVKIDRVAIKPFNMNMSEKSKWMGSKKTLMDNLLI